MYKPNAMDPKRSTAAPTTPPAMAPAFDAPPSSLLLSSVLSSFGADDSTLSTDTSTPAVDKASSRFLSRELDTDDDKSAADEIESSASELSDTTISNETVHVYMVARRRRRLVPAVCVTAKFRILDSSTETTLAMAVLRVALSAFVGAALALMLT